ncbi:MAG: thioredoxin [Trichodesmium sp. MAG_R02]|jgi:thioredoxin 1|nr:thioredoxin [Trichodesmium sp. MAG_R02]
MSIEQPQTEQSESESVKPEQVTDQTFKERVLNEDEEIPVLVDFWAPWCGPCRMVSPIVDEVATIYKEKVKVFKLNTDENPNTASKYGIRSIPTLMIFKKGQRLDMVVGAVPKSTLATTLEKHIEPEKEKTEQEKTEQEKTEQEKTEQEIDP